MPRKHIEEILVATEAGIAAVGKILEFHPEATGNMPALMQISELWLSWLPLKYDPLEGKQAHERLLRFLATYSFVPLNISKFIALLFLQSLLVTLVYLRIFFFFFILIRF